jgi:hypothetical protein
VIGSPSNYDNAYFEVRSVRVFGTSSAIDLPPGANGISRETRTASVILFGALLTAALFFLVAL